MTEFTRIEGNLLPIGVDDRCLADRVKTARESGDVTDLGHPYDNNVLSLWVVKAGGVAVLFDCTNQACIDERRWPNCTSSVGQFGLSSIFEDGMPVPNAFQIPGIRMLDAIEAICPLQPDNCTRQQG